MEEIIPDFILQADNVYRTRNYIVKQRLEYIENTTEDNVIISYDTFYKRTQLRDKQYIIMYGDKHHPNGKRMPSTTYTRVYID